MEKIESQKSKIENLRSLVEAETGMDFSGGRFTRLSDAVEKVVAKHNLDGQLDRILTSSQERGSFLEHLTAELTVGESFFFRNEHHFRALREQVLPDILRNNAERREIRIWSAGCAGGEEPHSLAILIDQLFENRKLEIKNPKSEWQISILGTDVNTEFLRRAREAEYRAWSFRRTDVHVDARYFTALGDNFRLLPGVRDCVRFVHLNLVKDVYPSPLTGTVGLDLILFRNVAIYLQPTVVQEIVRRFYQCLHPGGWLLLGEAEVSHIKAEQFQVVRFGSATFFQRPPLKALSGLTTEPSQPVPSAFKDRGGSNVFDGLPRPVIAPTIPDFPARNVDWKAPQTAPSTAKRPLNGKPIAKDMPDPFDWDLIEQLLTREDFEAAESLIASIRDRRKRASIRFKLARRLLDLSEGTRARSILDACLEDEPLMIDAHLLKASLSEERGELGQAEAACRRALYLDRNCAMAHFHLALVQQQSGNLAGAKKSFRLVQKLAKTEDAHALVEHGDGICYGRLSELAQSMMES